MRPEEDYRFARREEAKFDRRMSDRLRKPIREFMTEAKIKFPLLKKEKDR